MPTTIRLGAKNFTISEQIVEDPVSGLTLQFECLRNGEFAINIYGELPLGNRTLIFNEDGELAGTGTAMSGPCRATWIKSAT